MFLLLLKYTPESLHHVIAPYCIKFNPASYKEIANSLIQNGVTEMYHDLVNVLTVFTIPNIKIFWCCRCHLVADDKSTAHEHLHALVQYDKGHTHRAFEKRYSN